MIPTLYSAINSLFLNFLHADIHAVRQNSELYNMWISYGIQSLMRSVLESKFESSSILSCKKVISPLFLPSVMMLESFVAIEFSTYDFFVARMSP